MKIIAALVASFALVLTTVPAFADTQDPVHLTVEDLHCYEVGLVLGSNDSPCQDPIACVPGDATCAWVCDIDNQLFSVQCSNVDANPGLLNWLNILYGAIGHYRSDAARNLASAQHESAVASQQASRIRHLRNVNRRLRKALARARHHR